jgi:hypothetical protein
MPGYVEKALTRFRIINPKGANSPFEYLPPEYGKVVQYEEESDGTSPVAPEAKTRI